MRSSSSEEVIDAFVDILREQLAEGNRVEVPGLGTFSVEHRPSTLDDEDETMTPPRIEVCFDPESA
ncbi:MAG: HU family DNA-binding protein [Salinibacter sp.]|uniref:HU family DNA-binding protein n=1 Tax=Salinibacter sp. TaxID=2065818 RepID=UPI0035D41A32